jgi:hypothetical protein
MSKRSKSMETENRLAVARSWEGREWEEPLMDIGFPARVVNVQEADRQTVVMLEYPECHRIKCCKWQNPSILSHVFCPQNHLKLALKNGHLLTCLFL